MRSLKSHPFYCSPVFLCLGHSHSPLVHFHWSESDLWWKRHHPSLFGPHFWARVSSGAVRSKRGGVSVVGASQDSFLCWPICPAAPLPNFGPFGVHGNERWLLVFKLQDLSPILYRGLLHALQTHGILNVSFPWASLIAQLVKSPPATQETPVWILGQKIPWRRDRLPTHNILGLLCGSAGKESAYVQHLGWEDPLENSMDSPWSQIFLSSWVKANVLLLLGV